MTTTPLTADQVTGLLRLLQPHVAPIKFARLADLVPLIREDGRIVVADALGVVAPQGGDASKQQDTFRKFRAEMAGVAQAAGVDLRVIVEDRKVAPQRRLCWFVGTPSIDADLADLSQEAAESRSGEMLVPPRATRVIPSRPVRVFVVWQPRDAGETRRGRQFLEALAQLLAVTRVPVALTDTESVPLGEERQPWADRQLADADVVLVLVSVHLLVTCEALVQQVIGSPAATVACAATALPPEADLRGFQHHDVLCADRPLFVQTAQARPGYVQTVGDAVNRAIDRLRTRGVTTVGVERPDDRRFEEMAMSVTLSHLAEAEHTVDYVPPRALRTSLSESTLKAADARARGGEGELAVKALVDWACGADGADQCALLGDLGMGKTTTTKLVTRRLLELRADDPSIPLPLLFDLRDIRPADLRDDLSLTHILGCLLRQSQVRGPVITAAQVIDRIDEGGCLVIFDGLDEVLVHLSVNDQAIFTRSLWRTVPPRRPRGSRLLLSCRTHYFRTIAAETAYFSGQHRDGPSGADYLALLMLPFTDEQIRAYFQRNLGVTEHQAHDLLELLDSVHNLHELATRPVTLRMLADQLDLIEAGKLHGRTIRAVDVYADLASRWLHRDSPKERLNADHKLLLMQELAAQLWRDNETSWTADRLEQWLLEFMAGRPDLTLHYQPPPSAEEWKSDLRTATFVARRNDDTFGFAHRSLFEYFLAGFLHRSLTAPLDLALRAWTMPLPSRETFDFLGQLLAGTECEHHLAVLGELLTTPNSPASKLAFGYALHATHRGLPSCPTSAADLRGQRLDGWVISGSEDEPLNLTGALLAGASLVRARVEHVNLTGASLAGADLSGTELHHCDLARADLTAATIIGTIARRCIGTPILADTTPYRAQALWCTADLPGWTTAPATHPPDVRPRLRPLTGHSGSVWAVAVSGDGSRVYSGGADGVVRVWDAATGQPVDAWPGHTGWVWAVAVSGDGSRVYSGGADGVVRVWDAATGQPVDAWPGHTGWVWAVAVSGDGSRVYSGGDDGVVRVWDAATGQPVDAWPGHTGWVWAVAVSGDGSRVYSGGDDGVVRVWDAATGQPVDAWPGHTGSVLAVAVSGDGSRVYSGGADGVVRVWDAATGQPVDAWPGHTGSVWAVAVSGDGSRVYSGGDDGVVRVWDAATGQPVDAWPGHTGWVWAVAVSGDGSRVYSGGADGVVRVWDAATGQPVDAWPGHTGWVRAVAVSGDGSRVYSGGADGVVRVWDAATGQPVDAWPGHTGSVSAVAVSGDGSRVYSGGADRVVRVWDAATGQPVDAWPGHTGSVLAVAVSGDGSRVYSGGADGVVRVWDAATGQPVDAWPGHTGSVLAVAVSGDGSRVYSGGADGVVRVWDAATGQPVDAWPGHTGSVWAVAVSGDGSRVYSGGADRVVRVWDAATGQPVDPWPGHTGWVRAVAVSGDGSRVYSGGDDGVVRVWDAATGQPVDAWPGHTGSVSAVAVSGDGSRVYSGGLDGTLRTWDPTGNPGGTELRRADHLPGQNLALWDSPSGELLGATDDAWRWLGYPVSIDGRPDRLPAETFGPLPPLATVRTD